MKYYINADKLRAKIIKLRTALISLMNTLYYAANYKEWEAELNGYDKILSLIDSLQQEPTPDTDVLYTKLVNLLKTYRIGEETAIILANRIADTYGAQRYMDGLCDKIDKEDTNQEQSKMDFEKELEVYAKKNPSEDIGSYRNMIGIARHFYELGLNTGKK